MGSAERVLLENYYYYINIPAAIAIVLSNQNFMVQVQPALKFQEMTIVNS